MRPREVRVVAAAPAVVAAGVLPGFLTASLAPLIGEDFDFGGAALGISVAAFYVVCTVASTPAGHVAERIGADRAVALTALTVAASCLGIALLADMTVTLIVLLLLGGIGDALAGPACSLALGREVTAKRHGVAFGALQAGAPSGALLAGLALVAIGIPFGWRWAFAAAAVFAAGAGLAMPRLRSGSEAAARERPRRADPDHVAAVRELAVAALLASAAGVSLVSFIVLESVGQGIDEAAAGMLLVGISLIAALSRIAAGAFADRKTRSPVMLAARLLALSSVGYLLLASGSEPLILVGGLIAGFGWSWPGVLTLAVTRLAPEAPGWAVGVMMSGLFAGALLGPLALGFLFEGEHFALAWLSCFLLSLAAAGVLVYGARQR